MIFAVEDDDSIREIEIYTLTSVGFKARGFADAASLYKALEDTLPDLIILDVMLPGESGLSVLRHLKERREWRDIPVIMATAKGSEYDKVESLDAGADDYLVKPFGMMEMVEQGRACGHGPWREGRPDSQGVRPAAAADGESWNRLHA